MTEFSVSELRNVFPLRNGEQERSGITLAFVDHSGNPIVSPNLKQHLDMGRFMRASATIQKGDVDAIRLLTGHLKKEHWWTEIDTGEEGEISLSVYFAPEQVPLLQENVHQENIENPIWKAKGIRIVRDRTGRKVAYLKPGSVKAGERNPSGDPSGWRVLDKVTGTDQEVIDALKEARKRSRATFTDLKGKNVDSLSGLKDSGGKARRVNFNKKNGTGVVEITL